MRYEKYAFEASDSFLAFEFISHGPKGQIVKRVLYSEVDKHANVYNLSFGDVLSNGEIDIEVVTDNKDCEKVLATVVGTIANFFEAQPDKLVLFAGSTRARTRLYQMLISRNLEELRRDGYIFGRIAGDWYPFERNINYDAFALAYKNNTFTKS